MRLRRRFTAETGSLSWKNGAQGVTHAADKLDEQIRARNSIITVKRATETQGARRSPYHH
jgi:hypothetical protein